MKPGMKMQKKMRPAAVEDQPKVSLTKRGRTVSHEILVVVVSVVSNQASTQRRIFCSALGLLSAGVEER